MTPPSADTPRTDADEQLREKVERIIGTAILKNDKNYTNDIMSLIKADREQAVVAARECEARDAIAHLTLQRRYNGKTKEYFQNRIKTLTAPSTAKGDKE